MINRSVIGFTGIMFFLLPWYYLGPGQPQPVDVVILMLMGLFVILGLPYLEKLIKTVQVFRVFLWFSTYGIVILLVDYILDVNDVTLRMLEHNLYAAMLAVVFSLLFIYLEKIKGAKFYNLILVFLLLDLILPFQKWMFIRSVGSREELTFSNANQLGFFALVNLSIFFYTILLARERNVFLNKFYSIIILNINLLFLFVSTSRACYSAILLYVFSFFLLFNIKLKGYTGWLVGVFGVFLSFFLVIKVGGQLLTYMQHARLDVSVATPASLMREFYFRAFKGIEANFAHTGSFLFGAGTYTTTTGRKALEFHNNFAAIFFQIGLIGLLFYLYLNIAIVKVLFKKGVAYLIPYICYLYYSMFHYSYRTRINWLLLAMIIFIIVMDRKRIHSLYFKKTNSSPTEVLET